MFGAWFFLLHLISLYELPIVGYEYFRKLFANLNTNLILTVPSFVFVFVFEGTRLDF